MEQIVSLSKQILIFLISTKSELIGCNRSCHAVLAVFKAMNAFKSVQKSIQTQITCLFLVLKRGVSHSWCQVIHWVSQSMNCQLMVAVGFGFLSAPEICVVRGNFPLVGSFKANWLWLRGQRKWSVVYPRTGSLGLHLGGGPVGGAHCKALCDQVMG